MYVLLRTDNPVPGVEIIQRASSGGFSTGYISTSDANLYGAGLWMEEITREEADAIIWLWNVNSYRKDDGRNVGDLIKIYPTEKDLESAVKVGKRVRKKQLADVFNKKFIKLKAQVSELESASWGAQLAEAKAFLANKATPTPVLSALVEGRNVTVEELAQRVVAASAAFDLAVARLLNEQQTVNDQIKACTELSQLWAIKPEEI